VVLLLVVMVHLRLLVTEMEDGSGGLLERLLCICKFVCVCSLRLFSSFFRSLLSVYNQPTNSYMLLSIAPKSQISAFFFFECVKDREAMPFLVMIMQSIRTCDLMSRYSNTSRHHCRERKNLRQCPASRSPVDTKAHRELCTVMIVVAPPMTRARTAYQCRRGGRYLGNTKFDSPNHGEKQGIPT